MRSFIIAAAAAAVATPALAETRTFDLEPFTAIDASIAIIDVTVGEAQSVTIEIEDGDFDDWRIRSRGGEFEFNSRSNIRFGRRDERPRITITVPSLEGLDLSAGAQGDVQGVEASDFEIDLSSGAFAEISGSCEDLEVDLSSGARLDGEGLICISARADASSGSSGSIHASESITADASSGARLRVHGQPKNVRTDTSSGGSVNIN